MRSWKPSSPDEILPCPPFTKEGVERRCNMKPFTKIAVGVFSLICLIHIVRLMTGFEVVVGGWAVPLWVSVPGAIVTGALAYMLWKEMH
jgi:uncharacterized integral membrane protein